MQVAKPISCMVAVAITSDCDSAAWYKLREAAVIRSLTRAHLTRHTCQTRGEAQHAHATWLLFNFTAACSSGMIPASGARGHVANSRSAEEMEMIRGAPYECSGSVCVRMRMGSVFSFRWSIVVSISACHAEDPGSIPGGGVYWLLPAHGSL